jgi:hypothetical protein
VLSYSFADAVFGRNSNYLIYNVIFIKADFARKRNCSVIAELGADGKFSGKIKADVEAVSITDPGLSIAAESLSRQPLPVHAQLLTIRI